MSEETTPTSEPLDFIREIITEDLKTGKHTTIQTRFPPEPNGYLHIGHAKALCLDFGLPEEFGGACNLRMDDTNPAKEDMEYVENIKRDIEWLGFKWKDLFFASDYYETLYQLAEKLITKGLAYVCDLTGEEVSAYRGNIREPGKESPYRNRSVEENLDLFRRMRNGEFPDGSHTLRAKIDMSHPNIHMRDPVMYRIMREPHYRMGDKWCIYPMYDYAHPISDALEGITHSLCTLEFEIHRPLYDWFVQACEMPSVPRQIEFSRLNITYTVMSKRKLLELVKNNYVNGWDDPRMPTLSGLRRRGYTAAAIRKFCKTVGITKFNGTTDVGLLEFCLREDLNKVAQRVMSVFDPLKVTITNMEDGHVEWLNAVNNPEDETAGTRKIPFTNKLWIEKTDFMSNAPSKFFRLTEGRMVRLRYGPVVICDEAITDENGNVVELKCRYLPETLHGANPEGNPKIKGVIHWLSTEHACQAEIRLYDRLFCVENPDAAEGDYKDNLNAESLQTIPQAYIEQYAVDAEIGTLFQFERIGYFRKDEDSTTEHAVFNRSVTLKDTWNKKKGN